MLTLIEITKKNNTFAKNRFMAKALNFKYQDHTFSANIEKVDRKKIYGYTQVEYKNENGELCSLANVTSDGMSILPSGCTGIVTVNEDGKFIGRSELQVVDTEGNPLTKIPSVFDNEAIELTEASIEDYLDINVKSIYQLSFLDDSIKQALDKSKVLSFKFNYRADYQQDDAFLVCRDDNYFVVTGFKVEFDFVGLDEQFVEPVMEEVSDEMDFGMM